MSKFNSISTRLNSVFEKIKDTLEVDTRSEFFIIDFEGQSYLILDFDNALKTYRIKIEEKEVEILDFEINKTFRVFDANTVALIPIDGKRGLFGFGESFCDFVIFDENDFCFVEFKLNATSLQLRAIRKNRTKAVKQLSNTISKFDDALSKNYEGLNLEAYICTPETYPREDSSWQSISVAFLETFGIGLFEKTEKQCN